MINWWWLRHGPTHEKTFVGWRDVPADLSDTAAIERLRAYLPKQALVVSSDLKRAVATADAIESAGHKRLAHAPDLREFNFGEWDGLGFDEVSARDPALSRAYWETPGDITPPGGESWNQAAIRVGAWVDSLNDQGGVTHVIAVAHIGVIMTQIQKAGGLSAVQTIGHKIDNLSVTNLCWDGAGWQTKVINHLA
ncbi:MAG: histidine phosphatase family protein [Rhodobacteraceae bacterium]|nr:histidine phosphatase family protein [Paracoccaceae bacterium]